LFIEGGVRYQTNIKDILKGGFSSLVDLASSKLGIDKGEAEKIILSEENLNNQQKAVLAKSFEVQFQSLADEIQDIVDYYSQLSGKEAVEKGKDDLDGIYLYGKGAKVFHLKEFLIGL